MNSTNIYRFPGSLCIMLQKNWLVWVFSSASVVVTLMFELEVILSVGNTLNS